MSCDRECGLPRILNANLNGDPRGVRIEAAQYDALAAGA